MAVFQKTFRLSTRGRCDVVDISEQVSRIVGQSGVKEGIACVSGRGSTLGVTTIEYEDGAVADLARALERIAPMNHDYAHNAHWGDDNGYAHLRSALIGASRSFSIRGGALDVGTWQQIVFCDFDSRPREREVTVTVVGE